MKRKKVLPADFEEMLKRGNVEEIKDALEQCEPDAHVRYEKKTVLFYDELPEKIIRYLVEERGADVNAMSENNNTVLEQHAFSHPEHIPLLIELGADVNYHKGYSSTPLYSMAGFHRPESVKILLEHGADPTVSCGWFQDTPMENALKSCRPADIANTAAVAELLLEYGAPVTEKMKKEVTRIGTDFEFMRKDFNPDYLEETEKGLEKLYRLFLVPPVPRRKVYDGVSLITVKSKTWQKQHAELWEMLVPGMGNADTVQGEVIRIVGKLCYEILDNGACNWDREYKKLTRALAGYLGQGIPAEQEAVALAKGVFPRSSEKELYLLNRYCVEWVLKNPEPMQLDSVEYKR